MSVVLPVRQRTPEWLEARTHGIGASEAAAAIGLSAWKSPMALWAEKLGLVPPTAETPSMRIGTALEPLIAAMYTEATGVTLRRANNLRRHPQYAWMLASIDRRAGRKPVELKFSARAQGYGEPGTDEVPDDVLVQVLHQLAVLDEAEGDVALLRPGADGVAIYPIVRTAEAEAAIVEREAVFWDHVQRRVQPPLDASDSTREALNAMYPRVAERVLVEADPAASALMVELHRVRGRLGAYEGRREEIEIRIRAAMLEAGATVIRAAGVGEIPWSPVKDRKTTDWKAAAAALSTSLGLALAHVEAGEPFEVASVRAWLEGVEDEYTTTKPSTPRFGPPKWEEEE